MDELSAYRGSLGFMREERLEWSNVTRRKRSHLPHLDVQGGLYFVTWCLADAIPAGFLRQKELERNRILGQIRQRFGAVGAIDIQHFESAWREKFFSEMDRGGGGCELSRPQVAEMVCRSLEHFDGDRYRLFNYSVMPNHVHVIYQPLGERQWWEVTGAWKSFTSKAANRILGRKGRFWQDDSWDQLIRSKGHFEAARKYVLENPLRAGLENWSWVADVRHPAATEQAL